MKEVIDASATNDGRAADLDWLAFAYVLDELAPAEREAFEVRLDEDQAAREAVARAAGLAEELTLASTPRIGTSPATPSLHSPNRLSPRRSIQRWGMVAISAALAVALVMSAIPRTGEPASRDTDSLVNLASTWNEVSTHDADVAECGGMESVADEEMPASVEEDSAIGAVPQWMIEAVAANDPTS